MLRGGIVMVAISGAIGTSGLIYSGMVPMSGLWPAFIMWSLGDLLGIVCVAPTLLLFTAPGSNNPDEPEASDYSSNNVKTAWVGLLLLSHAAVYLGGLQNSSFALGLVALPLSLLMWSALRFQPLWTAAGTMLTVLFLTSLTGLGLAGFRAPTGTLDAALLLCFMGLVATVPLVLVASINEQRMATRKVLRRATTDAATNLPNRAAFEEAVQKALAGETEGSALAYLDLDHFTLINDTASHAAGDALIHGIGSLLKARLRAGDQVFRIGGDEFALLLDRRRRHHGTAPAAPATRRGKLPGRLAGPRAQHHRQRRAGHFQGGRDRVRAPALAGRRRLLHGQGTGRQPGGAGQPETGRDA